jgi:hypothetical protein
MASALGKFLVGTLAPLALAASLGFVAQGCGAHDDDRVIHDTNAQTTAALTPVRIVIGGFASCGSFSRRARTIDLESSDIQPLARGATPNVTAWVQSCFDGNARLWFRSDRVTEMQSTTRDQLGPFFAFVRDAVGTGGAAHIIGHSHGGWLAMKTALDLAGPAPEGHPAPTLASLITVDPISATLCSRDVFLRRPLRTKLACMQAPGDFTQADLDAIGGAAVLGWKNFYQDVGLRLRSGPFATERCTNIRVDIPEPSGPLDALQDPPHVAIQREPVVWEALREFVATPVTPPDARTGTPAEAPDDEDSQGASEMTGDTP